MTNNDILRRIRYIFDFSDSKMTTIFGLADYQVTREQISNWLRGVNETGASSGNASRVTTIPLRSVLFYCVQKSPVSA